MKNEWRLILSGKKPALYNMAVDEALFLSHMHTRIPVFRIYGWEPPSFSVGYSQNPQMVLDTEGCAEDGIPIVRRITGGGIIYHGDEVTYSVACSRSEIGELKSVKDGYRLLCTFIMEAYRRYGLKPGFAVDLPGRSRERSTFCFSSFEDYDIVINGKKIGGNAQKRSKEFILQHGSIPLGLNYERIESYVKEPIHFAYRRSTSLREAAGKDISFGEFAGILRDSFTDVFSAVLKEDKLTPMEEKLVEDRLASMS